MADDLDFSFLDMGDDTTDFASSQKKSEPVSEPEPAPAPIQTPAQTQEDDDLLFDVEESHNSPIIEEPRASQAPAPSSNHITNDDISEIDNTFSGIQNETVQEPVVPKVPSMPAPVINPGYAIPPRLEDTTPQHAAATQPVQQPVESYQPQKTQPSYEAPAVQPNSQKSFIPSNQQKSFLPEPIALDLINKIIAILESYRSLEERMQDAVAGFLMTLDSSNDGSDYSEAQIIKSVIEINPNTRDAVHNFIGSYNKKGAERAFYLMSLNANQLNNLSDVISISTQDSTPIHAKDDSLASIRSAAEELDKVLEAYPESNIVYIKPIDDILQKSLEIMQS